MTRQALAKAVDRGGLFGVKVGNRVFYPSLLSDLPQATAERLSLELAPLSSSEKLLFLLRQHGGLGGKTVQQALEAGREDEVMALARAWADEQRAAA